MFSKRHSSEPPPAGFPDSASESESASEFAPAAFFDMDNTLLRIDSAMAWMRFLRRRGEISRGGIARALYWSTLYKLAVLDMESLADHLAQDLCGRSEFEMIEKCRAFFRADVASAVAPAALESIRRHRARGHVVALLTGSTQYVAEVVAASLGLDHALSSRVEVVAGKFTGRMATYGFGTHKVTLAERFARERGIDLRASWFYSDSFNDLPMLERVGRAVAVNPDARLRRHARRAGWPIEVWR